MTMVIGFILGYVLAVLVPVLREVLAAKTRPPSGREMPAATDDESRRRTERAWREYRNFMTYDGYAQQDDQS